MLRVAGQRSLAASARALRALLADACALAASPRREARNSLAVSSVTERHAASRAVKPSRSGLWASAIAASRAPASIRASVARLRSSCSLSRRSRVSRRSISARVSTWRKTSRRTSMKGLLERVMSGANGKPAGGERRSRYRPNPRRHASAEPSGLEETCGRNWGQSGAVLRCGPRPIRRLG